MAPIFEFTPNYLRAVIYSEICSSILSVLLFILLSIYLFYYDDIQNSIINYKKLVYCYLLLLFFISVRSFIEWTSLGVIFDTHCELNDTHCKICERQYIVAPIIFLVYFIILLLFLMNLYQDLQGLKTIGIRLNKYIIWFMFILTFVPIIMSILASIKIFKVSRSDFFMIIIPFGSMEICIYNTKLFDYYEKLLEINNPYVFSVIMLYLIIYLYYFYILYKEKLNRRLNEPFIKLLLRNIFLSFTYIIVNFLTVLTPQYIFQQLPLTGIEYSLTMIVLFLYLPIGNLVYDKIYKYPTKLVIGIISTRTSNLIIEPIRDEKLELGDLIEEESTELREQMSIIN